MYEVLSIRNAGLVQATQDFAIGAYKGSCKILLPVALCDTILVPGLRMSLVEGGSKVVVSVILRLAAGVWPLECRDPYAVSLASTVRTHDRHEPLSCAESWRENTPFVLPAVCSRGHHVGYTIQCLPLEQTSSNPPKLMPDQSKQHVISLECLCTVKSVSGAKDILGHGAVRAQPVGHSACVARL